MYLECDDRGDECLAGQRGRGRGSAGHHGRVLRHRTRGTTATSPARQVEQTRVRSGVARLRRRARWGLEYGETSASERGGSVRLHVQSIKCDNIYGRRYIYPFPATSPKALDEFHLAMDCVPVGPLTGWRSWCCAPVPRRTWATCARTGSPAHRTRWYVLQARHDCLR